MTTPSVLVADLRAALRRLYDPNALRSSPLVGLLNLNSKGNVAAETYRALTEAIAALQPSANVPQQSRAWRTYETLYYRYVQQFSQVQVAAQLGLSVRQLRREERAALVTLAYTLARRHNLHFERAFAEQDDAGAEDPQDDASTAAPSCGAAVADTGAALLGQPATKETADLRQVIPAVLEIVAPLAARYDTRIYGPTGAFPGRVHGSPVLLRQILLSLLTVSIRVHERGAMCLSVHADHGRVSLRIYCDMAAQHRPIAGDDLANIEASRRLAQILPATLTESVAGQGCGYELALDSAPSWQLLVVDDHPDAQQLFARYTKGTCYQYHGVTDPERVLEQALAICPDLIVLDVIMPSIDGWQVLEWFKQTPKLCGVPLAVCTVLPHQELALARGADAFIAKPVSREAFLRSLDALTRLHADSHHPAA